MLTKPFKPLALAFLVNLIISVEDKIKYIEISLVFLAVGILKDGLTKIHILKLSARASLIIFQNYKKFQSVQPFLTEVYSLVFFFERHSNILFEEFLTVQFLFLKQAWQISQFQSTQKVLNPRHSDC